MWLNVAAQRLKDRLKAQESQRSWREDLHTVEDEMDGLASEARVSELPSIGMQSRCVGSGPGQRRWPMWMVQLILEQLIHGTPPAAIPDNILSQDNLTTGREGQEVPSVDFCRDMRIVLRILTETLAAYQLAQQKQWHQLFTDGTSRRQIALETLLIALDLLQLSKGAGFEAEARRTRAEREATGVGDSCAERQQQTAPLVDNSLLGERLEICCNYDLVGGGSEARWSAGFPA